jgi:hypothetical protein
MKEHRMSLHCREPRLEEMLADPIVKAVMEADGVDLRELEAELRQPRRYYARRGAQQIHRHLHGPIFAEREGSHEVPNRSLERHCMDCRLPCALPLCSQRFNHVEIECSRQCPLLGQVVASLE